MVGLLCRDEAEHHAGEAGPVRGGESIGELARGWRASAQRAIGADHVRSHRFEPATAPELRALGHHPHKMGEVAAAERGHGAGHARGLGLATQHGAVERGDERFRSMKILVFRVAPATPGGENADCS